MIFSYSEMKITIRSHHHNLQCDSSSCVYNTYFTFSDLFIPEALWHCSQCHTYG